MMVVRQFPPRESCRIRVILLSLYGTWLFWRIKISPSNRLFTPFKYTQTEETMSDLPFPQREPRWRFPAPTEICWCSSPRPARRPPLPSYWPVPPDNIQISHQRSDSLTAQTFHWLSTDLLAARQVDQVELPRQFLLRLDVFLLDVDEEDAVAARAVLVHV